MKYRNSYGQVFSFYHALVVHYSIKMSVKIGHNVLYKSELFKYKCYVFLFYRCFTCILNYALHCILRIAEISIKLMHKFLAEKIPVHFTILFLYNVATLKRSKPSSTDMLNKLCGLQQILNIPTAQCAFM